VAVENLLWNLFVVGHNISDSAVSDLFSWPPFLEFSDNLWDLFAFSLASQNQSYLFIFPCLDPDHVFELRAEAGVVTSPTKRWAVDVSICVGRGIVRRIFP
jgi:hypothetical protein